MLKCGGVFFSRLCALITSTCGAVAFVNFDAKFVTFSLYRHGFITFVEIFNHDYTVPSRVTYKAW